MAKSQTIDLMAWLKDQEGFSPIPYIDEDGWSIGYGHWAKHKEDLPFEVDEVEAEELLEDDIEEVEVWLIKHFPQWHDKLVGNRRKVIINLIFNVGYAGFAPPGKAFYRLIAAIDKEDWKKAAAEIVDSQLSRRRKTELSLAMLEG